MKCLVRNYQLTVRQKVKAKNVQEEPALTAYKKLMRPKKTHTASQPILYLLIFRPQVARQSPTMIEKLAQRRASPGPSGLLAVYGIQCLVEKGAEASVEDGPLGHGLREREVIVEVDSGP